jgi:hypothetical protein
MTNFPFRIVKKITRKRRSVSVFVSAHACQWGVGGDPKIPRERASQDISIKMAQSLHVCLCALLSSRKIIHQSRSLPTNERRKMLII